MTSAAPSSIPLPSSSFSSGGSSERVSMLPSVTLASASGLGSLCVVMAASSEALLLGAQAEGLRDLLDVGELLPLGQPAQVGEDAVARAGLPRLGDQCLSVGRPHLLAERLGQRGP